MRKSWLDFDRLVDQIFNGTRIDSSFFSDKRFKAEDLKKR